MLIALWINPDKGPGWGYQGKCFDCGEVGHKKGEAACKWNKARYTNYVENDTKEEGQPEGEPRAIGGVTVDGVWEINALEVEVDPVEGK